MSDRFDTFREQIQNMMAVNFEQDYFSPLAGRIFSQLIFAPEPISLQSMADNIGVSKAAVSIQARLLEKVGLCRRISKPNDRKDYYYIHDDFSTKVLELVLDRMKKSLQELDQVMDRFPQKEDVASQNRDAYEAGKKRFEEIRLLHRLIWERLSDMENVWPQMKKIE